MGGLTASGGCRCREEARVGFSPCRVCLRNRTESEGARARSRGRCHLPRPRRREERSPDSPRPPSDSPSQASRPRRPPRQRRTSPTPPPRPPPARARPVPHPRLPARPLARYAAAMSAQAQMRAMLDQLMGTSRDGKSLPEPWGWGRGRRRGGGRPPREHLGARVWPSKGLPDW